ncbi:MAG TPA: ABC transporter permease [Jiangellaceae bacterium]|nr:ABC transporter permease [Jiangellaceae bacterium]
MTEPSGPASPRQRRFRAPLAKVWSIARFNLVRMFRERANLFFVLVFPILIIAVLGVQFGDQDAPVIGVTGDGSFADRVAERIEDTGAARARQVESHAELRDLVGGGTLPVGVVVPDTPDTHGQAGATLEATVLLGSGDQVRQLEAVVSRALAAEAVAPGVTRQLATLTGQPADEVAALVSRTADTLEPVAVNRVLSGGGDPDDQPIGFAQIAAGMLLLMTFLNALTGAAALIQSRKHGVSRRMVATPTSLPVIVVGEGLGRWGVGMFQALYIMVATALLFGVTWGHLPTAIVLVALFAAVAAGAAMLIGAMMQNDEQAAGVTVMTGLALGALGGSMFPLELFGSTMRTVAHFTPHAWAIDAFTQMGRHGATLVDILPQLGVLAGMAALLIGLAAWRLRLTLTRL